MDIAKRTTIGDIAKRSGVSISTVSRVLNQTAPVADETRQAVLKAISDLNYKPNLFAQALAGGQTRTIGVLTQNLGSHLYDVILHGILRGINSSHYSSIFADGSWQADREINALQTLFARQIDGLVILGGIAPEEVLIEIASQVPLIIIGRDIAALSGQCLRFDDFQAAYDATQYLIRARHQRIVHITGLLSHNDAIERRNGYLQALKDAHIEPDPELIIEGDFLESSGAMAVEMLLMRGRVFSAIFAANDQMAYGARLTLHRHGLRVPEDVSIVGFDDLGYSAYMIPPLTSVARQSLEIGEIAAQALISLIKGEPFTLPEIQSTLSIRESVAGR
ncbi:MAG: LacI family DNA-binding transcriptional regulator [Chloroflexota bacterium]